MPVSVRRLFGLLLLAAAALPMASRAEEVVLRTGGWILRVDPFASPFSSGALQGYNDTAMTMDRAKRITLFLLRVVSGLLFLQAGGMKILDWFGGVPAQFGGHPAFLSQVWIGGVLELYGGAAIMLGLFTRPVAFILSGEMAVAYFQFHQAQGFWPIQNHGEPAVLLCFIFLLLAAHGADEWSVDALLKRGRRGRRGKRG